MIADIAAIARDRSQNLSLIRTDDTNQELAKSLRAKSQMLIADC